MPGVPRVSGHAFGVVRGRSPQMLGGYLRRATRPEAADAMFRGTACTKCATATTAAEMTSATATATSPSAVATTSATATSASNTTAPATAATTA
jgi:hypothetical protein